eukprot:TRINITY_DN2639_c0_g1_i7.p2 TRINITY_DN2639_c0_g1~~TRINITY_DN2639_c0_g1_i7.p2  ORF type:complete len:438 (+),score=92.69 TRINITY_DN2639_c0_g1_i7:2077-3390(+)
MPKVMPIAYSTPRNSVLSRIFTCMVQDSLNEFSYLAKIAGLGYNLTNTKEGLRLSVKGFNCKQSVLIEKIVQRMANLTFVPDRFETIKENESRSYKNFDMDAPYHQCMYRTGVVLEFPKWKMEEYQVICPTITLQEVKNFADELFKSLYIVAFCNGNLTLETATETMSSVFKLTGARGLTPTEVQKFKLVNLERGKEFVYNHVSTNPEEKNSCIEVYLQVGPDTEDESHKELAVLLELFSQCTNSSCYLQLRTEEQLGYLVWSGSKRDGAVNGFRVIVQSSKVPPHVLDERIETWLASVEQMIEEMSEEEFASNVAALVATKREKDKSLKEQTFNLWSEVQWPRLLRFNRREEEAAQLETIQKSHLLHFYRTYIARDASSRAKLSTRFYCVGHLPTIEKEGEHLITNVNEWQANLTYFSPPYVVLESKLHSDQCFQG